MNEINFEALVTVTGGRGFLAQVVHTTAVGTYGGILAGGVLGAAVGSPLGPLAMGPVAAIGGTIGGVAGGTAGAVVGTQIAIAHKLGFGSADQAA
jgi:hypothetical protein